MSKLEWDKTGERFYETGVDHVALYLQSEAGLYTGGVAWNGVTAINENPSGAEATPLYADNIKYIELRSAEDFGAGIEAYTYPDEFAECDGTKELVPGVTIGQQNRKSFGLSYRTAIGNDTKGTDNGYYLHLVYGAMASPSEKSYSTISDSPDAITFSWEITTTPVAVTGAKPTAHLRINSTKVDSAKLKQLEEKLYGTAEAGEPTLPLPDEVVAIFKAA